MILSGLVSGWCGLYCLLWIVVQVLVLQVCFFYYFYLCFVDGVGGIGQVIVYLFDFQCVVDLQWGVDIGQFQFLWIMYQDDLVWWWWWYVDVGVWIGYQEEFGDVVFGVVFQWYWVVVEVDCFVIQVGDGFG